MNGKLEDAQVDDELIDEIADEILDSLKRDQPTFKIGDLQRRNLSGMVKLQTRITNLENRVEKCIKSFKINATESVRQISETERSLENENEQQTIRLQGQIEDLRMAMIRLSNEVKRIREILSPSK